MTDRTKVIVYIQEVLLNKYILLALGSVSPALMAVRIMLFDRVTFFVTLRHRDNLMTDPSMVILGPSVGHKMSNIRIIVFPLLLYEQEI